MRTLVYDHRVIRKLRHKHERKLRAWRAVPELAWALMVTALILDYGGLRLALQLDPMSPAYKSAELWPLVVFIIAGACSLGALLAYFRIPRSAFRIEPKGGRRG